MAFNIKMRQVIGLLEALEAAGGSTTFTGLSDTPNAYTGEANKYVRVNGGETALEFVTLAGGGDMLSTNNLSDVANVATARTNLGINTTANQSDSTNKRFVTDADLTTLSNTSGINTGDETIFTIGDLIVNDSVNSGVFDDDLFPIADVQNPPTYELKKVSWAALKTAISSYTDTLYPAGTGSATGTNTGDQTSIVGISGTKAQFDISCSDGNFLYVGDVTQYTDEMAQDAIGAMIDASLVYVDATTLLQRAALTGAITASAGSNTTALGSFTISQLNTAVSDADVATLSGSESLTNKKLGSLTSNGFVKTGSGDGTLSVDTNAYRVETATAGIGTSPTATQTDSVTHSLGRTPKIIRIYGMSQFTSNAAATPTPFSIGIWTSASGNRCITQTYNTAAITTTQNANTSSTYAINIQTGANSFVTGVIQNVGATTFDIAWTETGTAVAKVYMWEAE